MLDQSSLRLRTPELRARLGRMTQTELARRSGLSKATISNLESGKLRRIELETIAKLSRALTCSINELFEFSDQAEVEVAREQRKSLKKVQGKIHFESPFEPDKLDSDLAEIIDSRIKNVTTSKRRRTSR
jgi:DNA-binding Xre family transcriptional regulator